MKIRIPNKRFAIFAAILTVSAGVLFFGNSNSAHGVNCDGRSGMAWQICETLNVRENMSIGAEIAKDGAKRVVSNAATETVMFVLEAVLALTAWFLNASVALLKLGIDVDAVKNILLNDAIYTTWQTIRDLCNLLFIFILLFSAFATIFQASKYNYKNILLWLIIMALLVNFSYPITLFIIDISNSLMYEIFKEIFNDAGTDIITTQYLFGKDLANILTPPNPTPTSLMISIIFVFILFLTILALSLILIIRTIALAIIIIFSPIGFVGTIIGKDGGWWNYLFKYALAGPIIALVLLVSTRLMAATLGDVDSSTTADIPVLVSMTVMIIPIIILWMGMGMAVKGIEGSGFVMGKMQNFAKKTGRNIGGLRPAASWLSKKSGLTGATQQRWAQFKREGKWLGSDAVAGKEANLAGKFGVKGAAEDFERGKIAEIRKKWKDNGGATETDITDGLASGGLKAKAAAMEAAEKVGFGKGDAALENYQNSIKVLKGPENAKLRSIFNDKVKEKHIALVVKNDIKEGKAPSAALEEHLSELSPDQLAKQIGLHEELADENSVFGKDYKTYVENEIKPDVEYHKEFFKKLTKAQRQAYANKDLTPEGVKMAKKSTEQEGPKKSWEEMKKQTAQNAEAEMNKHFKPGEFS